MEVIDEAEDGPVELRFEAKGSGFTVWAGDAIVAAASGRPDRRVFAVNVQLDSRCDRGVAGRVLAEVEAIAAVPDAVVDMGNPVLRDEARRRGWTGPLRGPLTMGRPANARRHSSPSPRAVTRRWTSTASPAAGSCASRASVRANQLSPRSTRNTPTAWTGAPAT